MKKAKTFYSIFSQHILYCFAKVSLNMFVMDTGFVYCVDILIEAGLTFINKPRYNLYFKIHPVKDK